MTKNKTRFSKFDLGEKMLLYMALQLLLVEKADSLKNELFEKSDSYITPIIMDIENGQKLVRELGRETGIK